MSVERAKQASGIAMVTPWIIGLGVFTVYPFCASLYYSFHDWSVFNAADPIGFGNYRELLGDAKFLGALGHTFLYALVSIPAGVVLSLSLAFLLNAPIRGQFIYRAIYYLPHLVPAVASALLWQWVFNANAGLLNSALQPFYDAWNWVFNLSGTAAANPPNWLGSPDWAIWALILIAQWGIGQAAVIYLAKIQDVPQELLESAELDGAGSWAKIRHVILPMISPIILFNVIMSVIGAFQIFSTPFIMTGGGPDDATTFVPQFIYDNAFSYYRMGYACAAAFLLFLVILAMTGLAYWLSNRWVYYGGR
ncbi:MAG TPA: sugar ABC transporter permease [Planctomycetota bacterium]|nr:sugar ABC transporter permease [Planctomycetota bacterium]